MTEPLKLEPVQVGNRTIYMYMNPWASEQLTIIKSRPASGVLKGTAVGVGQDTAAAIGVVNKVLVAVGIGHGNSGGITQTKTGEVSQAIGTTASGLAVVVSVVLAIAYGANAVPVWGQIVCIVLLIVAGLCALIDSIWGTDPDKAIWAAAREYYRANAALQQEIIDVTNHIRNLHSSFNQLRNAFASTGLLVPDAIPEPTGLNGLNGLGENAMYVLNDEKRIYEQLTRTRDERIKISLNLMGQTTNNIKQTIDAINGKDDGLKIIMYSLVGISGLSLLYAVLTKNQKNENE